MPLQLIGFEPTQPFHAYCVLGPKKWWPAVFDRMIRDFKVSPADRFSIIDEPVVTIGHVRDAGRFMKIRPYQSHYKIVSLNGQGLSLQAAHALLKSLEEPLGMTIICLYVEQLSVLLPTIISRCQIIRPRDFDQPTRKKADGRPDDAQIPDLQSFAQRTLPERFQWVEQHLSQYPVAWLLDFWLKGLYATDGHRQNPALAHLLLNAKENLEHNVQSRLILEHIMLEVGEK